MSSATIIDCKPVAGPCYTHLNTHTMDSTVFGEPVVEIPGAILLSGFLQFFLLGIIVMQAMSYWVDYKDDSRKKRISIAIVVFLCLCVTCRGYLSMADFKLCSVYSLQTMLEGYKTWRTTIFRKRWVRSMI